MIAVWAIYVNQIHWVLYILPVTINYLTFGSAIIFDNTKVTDLCNIIATPLDLPWNEKWWSIKMKRKMKVWPIQLLFNLVWSETRIWVFDRIIQLSTISAANFSPTSIFLHQFCRSHCTILRGKNWSIVTDSK